MKTHHFAIMFTWLFAVSSAAQELPGDRAAGFDDASATVQRQLKESIAELDALRKLIESEQVPLSRQLGDAENELSKVRAEFQQASRLVDNRLLDLNNLKNQIKSRQEETTYLSNLLGEYGRNFESGLHIAELQRYRQVLEDARLAPENSNFSPQQIYEAQAALLAASLDRLEDALGGTRFEGSAVDAAGQFKPGAFVIVGPSAIFRSKDGTAIGTAEQKLGSLEPSIVAFSDPEDVLAAGMLAETGEGVFPLDPTRGNAHKVAETQETLEEHIRKGGPVMIPILALAGAALLVAMLKWLGLSLTRKPSQRRIGALLEAVARRDKPAAERAARQVGGHTGRMLAAGVEHLGQPRELIEEIMYERVLNTRLQLTRWLPFIAISASSAPLLGLLGTVTGIISTFKLITVFGSGDVKTLSGGISEALITTEFGLIVAIPSLLIHAFLLRKARGMVDQMEKAAVAFINQLVKTPYEAPVAAPPAAPADTAAAARPQLAPVPDVVVVPAGLKDAMSNIAEKLKAGDHEVIGAALKRLNHSAVEFVNTVYETTAANVGNGAVVTAEIGAGAEVDLMEPPHDQSRQEQTPRRRLGD